MVMKSSRLSRKIKLHLKGIVLQQKRKRFRKINAQIMFGPKVLVAMNTSGIGNAVEATPFVQAVRMLWPGAEITILTVPGDLFKDWSVPDRIITSTEKIRGCSYDHTFFTNWTQRDVPEWCSQSELGQVHFPKVWLGKLLLKPERRYYLDMLRKLGFKGSEPPLYVSLKKPGEHIPVADFRICLVPGGKPESLWRHKRWPYYNELLTLILEKYQNAQICIIGTRQDEFSGVLLSDQRIVDLRGNLTLRETAWVLKSANIAIGNDCGPMHIADAVQTRSIVIFGPTCELKNAYRNKVLTFSTDLPCRPCQYGSKIETCQDPKCMLKITPKQVMRKMDWEN